MQNLVFDVTKTCQITHLTKMTMKDTSRREGVGMLMTKFHIYSLFTTSHVLKKLRTIIYGKCSFSVQNSMGFVHVLTIVWSL